MDTPTTRRGRPPALSPAEAAHRALLILVWHEEGLAFRAIGQRLGVSPDHAATLWRQAHAVGEDALRARLAAPEAAS